MVRRKFPIAAVLMSALLGLAWGAGPALADPPAKTNKLGQIKADAAARKEAAKRLKAMGLLPGVAGLKATPATAKKATASNASASKKALRAGVPTTKAATAPVVNYPWAAPGAVPHYFGPYGNWAYSPLPKRGIASVTVDAPGSGYSNPLVRITDVYGTGNAAATATLLAGGINTIAVEAGSSGFHVPFVIIEDDPTKCGGADPQPPCGTGAVATANLEPWTLATGGLAKFVDKLPGVTSAGANALVTPKRLGPLGPDTPGGQYIPLGVPDTFTSPPPFVLVSDYYVIGLVEFYERMHSSLPPTRHRGYVQLESPGVLGTVPLTYLDGSPIYYPGTTTQIKAVDYPHFLGPTIVGTSNRAIRFKFYNLLPVGPPNPITGLRPGDLFIPVDETVLGSGLGPAVPGAAGDKYTQNRAAVHLHGNNTVWISDGTPHQWITPANETTPYPQGVSVYNVPDMTPVPDDPRDGTITLYYTNAMSARLMFYHDHAMGITRLNVYAGEAAGYVLQDDVEKDMINGTNVTGVNPGLLKVLPDIGIPLVIQDRTFVEAATIAAQDPTWNWGTGARDALGKITEYVDGDLWYPHIYMSAQNPWDLGGMNAFGRWHYGPWFNPPTPTCTAPNTPAGCIEVGPVPNEYAGTAPWEPPLRPGIPNPSIPGEAFNDTPIVNGTAYPYMEVEPRAYRFRILNAANDRFLNLQIYKAADKNTWTDPIPATPTTPYIPGTPTTVCAPLADPTPCTEVRMIPVGSAPNQTADLPSGLPDPATKGPDWIQIATEGGWLAAPVVVPQQPVGWNTDPTAFNVGVVNQHSLLLGTAERADVVVDFSAYAGQTLILYNDAPAAFPAGVPTYDYFTGVADQLDVGGAPGTLPGLGPNTRTIMQIRVKPATPIPGHPPYQDTSGVTLPNLQTVFAKGPDPAKRGVFEVTQDPIIVPQAGYNSAYNATFPSDASQFLHIADTQMTFRPINKDGVLQAPVTLSLQMKGMHDEMGGVYDTQFGRMSGMLGLTNPQRGNAFITPYTYASPPTDVVRLSDDVTGAPVGSLTDGTQIWRIFHNGVDTHPIHVHLFNAQLINRIGQDNWMVEQEPAEFGWKDTFRVNPLEVTFLAMKPIIPTQAQLPFEVLDSTRLIDPTLPEGASLFEPAPAGWFDPNGLAIVEILNHYVNFGWEYVWHCHILAHEEMDMMHSLVAAAPPMAPTGPPIAPAGLIGTVGGNANNPNVTLSWQDNSFKEASYRIERATNAAFTAGLTTFNYVNPNAATPNTATYTDATVTPDTIYWYRVSAVGAPVGDTWVYPGSVGFPTATASSVPLTTVNNVGIQVGNPPTPPIPPTNITAALAAGPQVTVGWTDNANNETGFVIERCSFVAPATTCNNFAQIAVAPAKKNTGNTSYVDATVTPGTSYLYQVAAINGLSVPPYTYVTLAIPVAVPAIPAAPTNFTITLGAKQGNNYPATLNWVHPGGANLTNFTVQRATNINFTTGLTTNPYAGNLRTATQNLSKNTTYYFRIRANNSISGSSTWTNALPFPIRTGP